MTMKTIVIPSMVALPNAPIEASRVEKPPVAMVDMACAAASNGSMPAYQ